MIETNKMRCSQEQAIKFIEEGIERTKNARNWEELEKYSAYARGYVFGLEICGFLDDDKLLETKTASYWEEQNRIAYSKGAANVCNNLKAKV